MEKFDISKVIERYKLNSDEVAKVIFPSAKYPKLALDRVIKGEGNLNTEQIEKLANHIGVLIQDLFFIDTWKGSTEDGCLTLLKDAYKVKLNYKGVFLSIYKNNELIEQKISDMSTMTIQEFINFLDTAIINYENGNN